MRKFDYSFLENQVPARLLNLTSIIYDIKGKKSVYIKKIIRSSMLFDIVTSARDYWIPSVATIPSSNIG